MPRISIGLAWGLGLALGAGLLGGVPLPSQAQGPNPLPRTNSPPAAASSAAVSVAGSPIMALSSTPVDGMHQIVLIDTQRESMGVYNVHPQSGEISLKAVRSFRYDLQMDEFGTSSPSPREIRAMLPRP